MERFINMKKNDILYLELEAYLKSKYKNVMCKPKEAIFSHIYEGCTRKFRYDFYMPEINVAVEVHGGQFVNGRHNRGGSGFENDLTKTNIAMSYNTKVYAFTYQMLERLEYLQFI